MPIQSNTSTRSRTRTNTKKTPPKSGHDRAEANRFEHLRDQNTRKKLEKSLGGTKKLPQKDGGTKTAVPGRSPSSTGPAPDPRKGTPETGFDRAENNRFQTISDSQTVDNSHDVAENNRFQTISDTQQVGGSSEAKSGLESMMEALKAKFEERSQNLNEQSQVSNGYRAIYQ